MTNDERSGLCILKPDEGLPESSGAALFTSENNNKASYSSYFLYLTMFFLSNFICMSAISEEQDNSLPPIHEATGFTYDQLTKIPRTLCQYLANESEECDPEDGLFPSFRIQKLNLNDDKHPEYLFTLGSGTCGVYILGYSLIDSKWQRVLWTACIPEFTPRIKLSKTNGYRDIELTSKKVEHEEEGIYWNEWFDETWRMDALSQEYETQ